MKIDSLQKENLHKDREIKRLSKDVQQYELTVKGLKKDVSMTTYHTPDVSKKDVSVTAEICCPGTKECGDMEPVKEYGDMLRGDAQYQARLQHMESSGESVRALREVNVSLSEEVHALHRVCAALDEQGRVAALRAQFKDEIIREMRRQLRQAKAQLKECSSKNDQMQEHCSYESLCRQPRKSRDLPDLDMNPNWVCNSPMYDGSGDDGSCKE